MASRSDWEQIGELGRGGQSDVYLVRTPARSAERRESLEGIRPDRIPQTATEEARLKWGDKFASAIWAYSRADLGSELGAMKVFRLRPDGDEEQARRRLSQEIAVLQQQRSGLPKLLDFNEGELWMV